MHFSAPYVRRETFEARIGSSERQRKTINSRVCTVYPFMVCTRLRVFVIIFAEMLARQTEAGRGAAEGFSKPRKPFTGILQSAGLIDEVRG